MICTIVAAVGFLSGANYTAFAFWILIADALLMVVLAGYGWLGSVRKMDNQ